MPVVPEPVKMALNAVLRKGKELQPGLRDFVFRNFEHFHHAWQMLPVGQQPDRRNVKFRLFHLRKNAMDRSKDAEDFRMFLQGEMVGQALTQKAVTWAKRSLAQCGPKELWVWLQYTGSYLWLWNAETELADNLAPEDLLRKCLYFACDSTTDFYPAKPGDTSLGSPGHPAVVEASPVPVARNNDFTGLRPGLINSFGALNYAEAMKFWPPGATQAEIYCFLRKEWLTFCTTNPSSAHSGGVRGAVSTLMNTGRLGGKLRPSFVDRCALELHKALGTTIKVGSFATFIPEISSHIGVERDDAIAALKFLVEVAACLRDVYGHNEMKFIEIVGGSRIQGVSYGWNNRLRGAAQAMIVPEVENVMKQLIKSLEQVVAHAAPRKIWLALEMEPGPLHLLRGLEEIERLLQEKSLALGVGVNLDLAHFCLLRGIQPDQLATSTRERILGAHISGHSKGHLGDLHVDALRQLKKGVFDTWLNYLAKLARDAKTDPKIKYRGGINIEMESCRCHEEVQSSWDTLAAYLR
jgi:sugar phosphate isomerase/epimerase